MPSKRICNPNSARLAAKDPADPTIESRTSQKEEVGGRRVEHEVKPLNLDSHSQSQKEEVADKDDSIQILYYSRKRDNRDQNM